MRKAPSNPKDTFIRIEIPIPTDPDLRTKVEAKIVDIAYAYDDVHSRNETGEYMDRIFGEILARIGGG